MHFLLYNGWQKSRFVLYGPLNITFILEISFSVVMVTANSSSNTVVLNLSSIEPHEFVESVSRVLQRSRILRLFSTIPFFSKFMFCSLNRVILCATDAWIILCNYKIYTYILKKSYFICPIMKGSVNALMKLAGFSTSNTVKNHWSNRYQAVIDMQWIFLEIFH